MGASNMSQVFDIVVGTCSSLVLLNFRKI